MALQLLITGANGFTGRHLICYLLQQSVAMSIHALHSSKFGQKDFQNWLASLPPSNAQVSHIIADITEQAQLDQQLRHISLDYVFHLAAISYVGHQDISAFYRVNVIGTDNILQALLRQQKPIKKILLASSANVYGRRPETVLDETLCPQPVNHYANSKLAMEHIASNYRAQLPILIPRPFNYTGAGQDTRFVVPKIVQHFAQQKSQIELGNTHIARDFMDVRQLVAIYWQLMQDTEELASSEVMNICTGKTTSLQTIIQTLQQLTGLTPEITVNPAFVRANDIISLCGDATKLKSTIGTTPQFKVADTLQTMLHSMQADSNQ